MRTIFEHSNGLDIEESGIDPIRTIEWTTEVVSQALKVNIMAF
ncbi:MAG: hypothetical protein AAGA77_22995 [Bacteroidota bacterium]